MQPNALQETDLSTEPVVSIIVITYDQDLTKIIKTLDSIVMQEGISFEIIICDDGSKERYEDELRNYFSNKNYSHYRLVFHNHNEGTVSNYYSGLQIAKGKYTKLISPGDCLTEKRTLYRWIQYLKKNNTEWSFSDTFYYHSDSDKMTYFRSKAKPQNIRPYLQNNRAKCMWNYTALSDIANGASIIGTKRTQTHFCKIIKDRGIRYCEDNIYRLMMFYGIVGCYFPEAAICYEFGTGISTSGDTAWSLKLADDRKKLIQIMLDERDKSVQQKRMLNALIRDTKTNRFGKLLIRGKLLYWLKSHYYPRLTPIPEE